MKFRGSEISFAPVYNQYSRVLILGSYPSPKSFEEGFYYGHPQNRFWKLIAALTEKEIPTTILDKKELLLTSHLALWDALESCQIIGASDTSIENPIPNNIPWLVKSSEIEAVFCNGAASHRFYTQFCQPITGIESYKMPSTSPANAAYSLPRLIQAWQPILSFL